MARLYNDRSARLDRLSCGSAAAGLVVDDAGEGVVTVSDTLSARIDVPPSTSSGSVCAPVARLTGRESRGGRG